jgi:hypothetical protein
MVHQISSDLIVLNTISTTALLVAISFAAHRGDNAVPAEHLPEII